ncbi:BTAD domain-containing putative transcriptional regulator [Streptomyces sp. NPDC090022]|uniref:BTAD domain-containing putative transcriptional regulator n=1 Tax=Streptomyces sp. NPDC090022 TaxID=3365920 RepID=UPI00381A2D2F
MRYLILGVTEARDETGAPLPVGGARLRALLAALALRAGRPVSVTELIDDVWGGDEPQDAPAALQALVSRLRRALGGKDAVRADTSGYRLDATPDDVDLHVFRRLARQGADTLATDPAGAADTLRRALELWRGPALADLPAATADARAAEARRGAAVRDRIEAGLRGGQDPTALLPELEALVASHPYDEPLHAQHLRALRAAGRPADALAAYEEVRRTLADGLGTDPGPELAALHAELLQAPVPERRERLERPERPGRPTGNLRPRLTSFVGREPELAALRADLTRSRLVTLTGPGGSGKTRLAEHSAAHHPDPVWLVELARLDHPAAVPGAVLSALGLRENTLVARETSAPADPTTRIVEQCAHRRLLLILDNCEHVIGAAARLAEELLTHCPGVRILATSREPLGVPGEFLRPVEPLPPGPALRLFADRGAAARPGFTVADDPEAAAEICARLDGLPLAIELAAARLRLLAPRQIADRLDDRFRLLTSGSRTVLPRQQTLRAVVDWSWDLLDAPERAVLRRLSVFAGGWDLDAAEAVCADPAYDTADTLGSLVDKSLVVADPTPEGEMRYRFLETIHEYATERAAEAPGERAAAAARHLAHFLALAEEAEPLLRSGAQLPWIRRIETELDNFRSALETTQDAGSAHRLVLALGWFWWLRNYRAEGAAWITAVLALDADGPEPPHGSPAFWSRLRLQLLHLFLLAESTALDDFRTPERLAEVRRLQEEFRRPVPESARFPGMLWPMISMATGNAVDFHGALDESVENCRRHGGDWELGVTLMLRTHVAIDLTGGLATVDADLAELHEVARRVGDRWTRAQVSSAAGEVALARGRYEWARAEYEECLRLAREVGAHTEAPFAMARIAEAAYSTGDTTAAEHLLAEAEAEADRHGVRDVRAFGRLLTGFMRLDQGDHAGARAAVTEARAAVTTAQNDTGRAVVPPQFHAGIDALDATLLGREEGPGAGLAKARTGLATAVEARCAEPVLARFTEAVALLLADAGRPAESVRALAAATAWRAGHPRSVPDERAVRSLPARTLAALGADRQRAEASAGAGLDPAAVLTMLTAVTGS